MDVMRGIYDGKVLNLVIEARNGHNTEQLRPDTYYILLWLVKALGQSDIRETTDCTSARNSHHNWQDFLRIDNFGCRIDDVVEYSPPDK